MSLLELLDHLRGAQIQLRVDGDELVFEGPRSAVTSEILDALRLHKAEILGLLRGNPASSEVASVIRSDPERKTGPLSFAQQRLWFLDRLEPQRSTYHINWALHLEGPLDTAALERSLREIIRRHAVLRTVYGMIGEEPIQTVTAADRFALERTDLSLRPEGTRAVEARRLVDEEADRPFDLSRDLMLRARLLRIGPSEHVLILVLHHIAMDGWSIRVLRDELERLYAAFARGKVSPLPELPVQYIDFALWQRDHLRGEVLDRQLTYWKRQLKGMPAVLELPLDHPRPPVQRYRGRRQTWTFPADLTGGMRAIGQGEGCTLFMTLLALFDVLLSRYTGRTDVFVGSPIANRTRTEIEPLIGFFVNTLVLRVDLSGLPTFRQVLRRVRDVTLNAYTHQDLPFEKLVEELEPERNLSHSPLAQVLFTVQNSPWRAPQLPDLRVTRWEVPRHTAKFDLSLFLTEDEGGLTGEVEYAEDLFDSETIVRLLGHFEQLMAAVLAAPDRPVAKLTLLTEAERRRQLIEWNGTAMVAYPQERTIHELFEAQATRQPDAVALCAGDRSLTYGELNAKANQVAHRLRRLGVGPDVPVGLCVERSTDMVVAVLGILKVGGAYTPIDPTYPAERLTFLLADSGASVWITERQWESLPAWGGLTKLVLDSERSSLDAESRSNPGIPSTSRQLAYLNYTSGSTGTPKAVGVPHQAVLRLVFGNEYAQLNALTVAVHLSPISFDAATFELWGPLLHGGRCVLLSPGVPTIDELAELVRNHRVTLLWLTSSLFNSLTGEGLERLAGLGELLIGGEALSVEHVRRAQQLLPGTQIVNCYGPTEATTFTTYHRIPQLTEAASSIPIGRPLANTRVYVLDPRGQPVPVGVPGELYIGGDGLARGYLGRPELTAEYFLPDPFGSAAGGRLYRTGDLVRWLPGGELDFLGRRDEQVKIRGFRVELGEVEVVLCRHPQVREAAVLVRDTPQVGRHLAAFVVPSDPGLTTAKLQEHCRLCLPVQACPASWVLLERLPINSNGKIDRSALVLASGKEVDVRSNGSQPRDMTELQLVSLWRQVLGKPGLDIHDDFFLAGGHSLLAVQLFAGVERKFGRRLPLATLFQAPTAALLAEKLRDGGWEPPWSCLIGLQVMGDRTPIFFVHALGGNVLNYDPLVRYMRDDQPFYALQAVGLDGQQTPFSRVEEMAAYYLREIRRVQPRGPYILGGASFGGLVAYEMSQLLAVQGEPSGLLLLLDSGPVERLKKRRAAEVQLKEEEDRFSSRLRNHLETLSRMGWSERQAYLREGWARFKDRKARQRRHRRYLAPGTPGGPLQDPGVYLGEYVRACHEAAAHRYQLRPYGGEVVLFLAQEQSKTQARDLVEEWQKLLHKPLTVISVPGDHWTMIKEPQIRTLAARLTEILENRTKSANPTLAKDWRCDLPEKATCP